MTSQSSCASTKSAMRVLSLELRDLEQHPVEGFKVEADEQNILKWTVAIFGPPCTIYAGGYFKATLRFPTNYPYSPPSFRFNSKFWHPNVYESGELCISILHPPVDDPQSGELPCERWNPTQNVRTILLSVISLFSEPNTSSPANVDASVMYRKWKEGGEKEDEYTKVIRKQVEASKVQAAKDGVKVPETVEDYVFKAKPKPVNDDIDLDFDDDYYYDHESDDEEEENSENGDSGNES
ncbi:Ubiquitin conjugating enzyme [Aphelenchoides fujianensis]|nr:Ubiquitin conjugating enzyme [Aphelenchoides fujianensis]